LQKEVELEIHKQLNNKKQPSDISTFLLKRITEKRYSAKYINSVMNFSLNCGNHKGIFLSFKKLITFSTHLPWGHFMEVMSQQKISVTDELSNLVVKAAIKTKNEEEIILTHQWDKWHPQIKKSRIRIGNERIQNWKGMHKELRERLGYFKNQRMMEKERHIIEKIEKFFPDDPQLKKDWLDFEDRWARYIISKSSGPRLDNEILELKQRELSVPQKEFCEQIYLYFDAYTQPDKSRIYDFSLCLFFMGQYQMALELLQHSPSTPGVDWFRLELMFFCRRYIECLDEIIRLDSKYSSDPETMFATSYIRAQSLWKLGQTASAIEMMANIVNIRPNYRSAHALLIEWTGGQY